MLKWFRFRVLSLLVFVSLIAIGLGAYLMLYQPGNISIRTSSGEILISHADIQFVEWEAQRYHLRPGLKTELSNRFQSEGGLIGGIPFHFCIDDDTILTGRLTTTISSIAFTDFAIDLLVKSEDDDTIELEYGYPPQPSPQRDVDPRFRHRLYTSLWLDGKLVPPNGG